MTGTPGPTLGRRLREARRLAGLSQEEVARRSGLSVRALRDIEQDRVRQPHPGSVERLTEALGLSEPEVLRASGATGAAPDETPAGTAGTTGTTDGTTDGTTP